MPKKTLAKCPRIVLTTTLNEIKKHRPCRSGWETLTESLGKDFNPDEKIPLLTILKANGINDVLWARRAVENSEEKKRILKSFALDAAEHVLYLFEKKFPEDNRPRFAIECAREFLAGTKTKQELAAAADAAYASRAAYTAYAVREKEIAWQAERLAQYLEGEL
jgi:hypothetical protein